MERIQHPREAQCHYSQPREATRGALTFCTDSLLFYFRLLLTGYAGWNSHTELMQTNHMLSILKPSQEFQDSLSNRIPIPLSTSRSRKAPFYETCQFSLSTTASYFHFRSDASPRHTVSVYLFYHPGSCFPQVGRSQGVCFKFIISCLEDEKPICLNSVRKPENTVESQWASVIW